MNQKPKPYIMTIEELRSKKAKIQEKILKDHKQYWYQPIQFKSTNDTPKSVSYYGINSNTISYISTSATTSELIQKYYDSYSSITFSNFSLS